MKKKKFNRQLISRIKNTLSNDEAIQFKKFEEKQISNKLKVNLSSTLKNIIKRIKINKIKSAEIGIF